MLTGVISGVARQAHNLKFLANEHSTTILTGLGVGGTAATAYLTGRASFKAARIIDREERGRLIQLRDPESAGAFSPSLRTGEKFKMTWKLYLPPFAVGVSTITCIITANKISSSKIAALAVASGISERALQEYKDKVFDKMGPNESRKLRDEMAQDRVDRNPPKQGEVIIAGTGDVLFHDAHSGRYFTSTVEKVRAAENKINHDLLDQMGCSLSEFYDEIGLPPSNYSDSVGWNGGDRVEIDFSTTLASDNRPCIVIDFPHPPKMDYVRHTYG